MNADDLHREGMRPERMGWLIRPIRRALFRLLRPFLLALLGEQHNLERALAALSKTDAELAARDAATDATLEATAGTSAALGRQMTVSDRRQADLGRRLDKLEADVESITASVRSAAAVVWDREAMVRRLAALEDAVNGAGDEGRRARPASTAAGSAHRTERIGD